MNAKELLNGTGIQIQNDFEVAGITNKFQEVRDGFIFFAKQGSSFDGHEYIEIALESNAALIICERQVSHDRCVMVDNIDMVMSYLSYKYNNCAVDNLYVIGITGTNGKTTTATIIYDLLVGLGTSVAVIGTNGLRYQDTFISLNNTTPDSIFLHHHFSKMQERGIKYVVMEVSSHGIEMERVLHIPFRQAIFTNFSSDHLDYHQTIESYFNAKCKLFERLSKNALAIINNEMTGAREVIRRTRGRVLTYGIEQGNFQAHHVRLTLDTTAYMIREHRITTKLVGHFNVYNTLAAIISVLNLGYSMSDIITVLSSINNINGRFEVININNRYGVVDFAHTSDAVISMLSFLNVVKKGKIITVIGCGGNRDMTKRETMGLLASNMSDYVVFTSDNPRFEDPNSIIDDMIKSVKNDNYYVIIDRRSAINKAVSLSEQNDMIVLLGKGSENYQIIKAEKTEFNDKIELIKALEGTIK